MNKCQPIRDVSGHVVYFSLEFCNVFFQSYGDIKSVLTQPKYLIEVSGQNFYFFKLLGWELNLMVEVRQCDVEYRVEGFIKNPSVEFITSLLEQGKLISFD